MSKDILKGIHRRAIGIGYDNEVVAPFGVSVGGDGKPSIVYPSPNVVSHFDDFLGIMAADTGAIYYNLKGTDTGGDNALGKLSGASGGVLRLQSPQNFAPSVAGGAPDMQGIHIGRNFQSSQGNLRASARVRISDTGTTPNGNSIFIGFTDDTGTVELPVFVDTGEDNSNANGEITAVAANAFGWLFDTTLDTGSGLTSAKWCGVAVAGGTLSAPVIAASGAVPNVWDTVETELKRAPGDTGGTVHFWLNGKKVGTISGPAVASNTKLSPVITSAGHHVSTGNVNKLDVDYWAVSATRDTGL